MWHVVHNDQLRTKIVGFANVERCIMEFGLIYIGKRTMICLHTFDDDVMCGKNCFVIVVAHELINYRLII